MDELKEIDHLPSNGDVLRVIEYFESIKKGKLYHVKLNSFYNAIATEIMCIWTKISIPIQCRKTVVSKVAALRKASNNKTSGDQCDAYLHSLFYIGRCVCYKENGDAVCSCKIENQIPKHFKTFLIDQLGRREMKFSDVIENTDNQQAAANGIEEQNFNNVSNLSDTLSSLSISRNSQLTDPDYQLPSTSSDDSSFNSHNRSVLASNVAHNIGQICDAKDISLRQAAVLLNAAEMKNDNDHLLKFDKNKISRIRDLARKEVLKEHGNLILPLICFQFDGKKSYNMRMIERNGAKIVDRSKGIENITILQQPGDNFLGFTSVTSQATGENIFEAIRKFFSDKDVDISGLIAVGCDGAGVNTGEYKGIITRFEVLLRKPLHRVVCMLHLIECAFRRIFVAVDGVTKAPNHYSGPIGTVLNDCEKIAVIQFRRILLENMPENIGEWKLTNDQKYLIDISNAISTGVCTPRLAVRRPGKVHNARWMTTASRILRVYVSTKHPSDELVLMTKFIMKVYVPMWIGVKEKSTFNNGSRHLFNLIHLTRLHTPTLTSCIQQTIYDNYYYAHSEMLLLTMITDEDFNIRKRALDMIYRIRREQREDVVRNFKRPENINYEAEHYSELIDWVNEIHEPPITKSIPWHILKAHYSNPFEIPAIPVHNQATEHHIPVVHQAVERVSDRGQRQQGYAMNKVVSRRNHK